MERYGSEIMLEDSSKAVLENKQLPKIKYISGLFSMYFSIIGIE